MSQSDDTYNDLIAANNALQQANAKSAATPVDVNDPESVARKQAVGRVGAAAAKDALFALAAFEQQNKQ